MAQTNDGRRRRRRELTFYALCALGFIFGVAGTITSEFRTRIPLLTGAVVCVLGASLLSERLLPSARGDGTGAEDSSGDRENGGGPPPIDQDPDAR